MTKRYILCEVDGPEGEWSGFNPPEQLDKVINRMYDRPGRTLPPVFKWKWLVFYNADGTVYTRREWNG